MTLKNQVTDGDTIEATLADERPFGDPDYANERTLTHYERRLEMLAEHTPVAAATRAALSNAGALSRYRVIGDPTVRGVINEGLAYFKGNVGDDNLEECEAILEAARRQLVANSNMSPLEVGCKKRLEFSVGPCRAWLWTAERAADPAGNKFYTLWDKILSHNLRLIEPDERTHEVFSAGARLLNELLPRLCRSALAHLHVAAVAEGLPAPGKPPSGFISVTNPRFYGTIFLSPHVLKTPWSVAEYLLHESMHLKFTDLEHTHSMLRHGYRADHSPVIRPSWHQPGKHYEWPVSRSVTVMHVYVCLALFFQTVERRASDLEATYGSLGNLDPARSARQAFDRAHFLGAALQQHRAELGVGGSRFVDWLTNTLRSFDPEPPPDGSDTRLLLDLYWREAEALKSSAMLAYVKSQEANAPLADGPIVRELADLLSHEAEQAKLLLSALGADTHLAVENETVASAASDEAARFFGFRTAASERIKRALSASGVRNSVTGEALNSDELVRKLVHESWPRVRALMGRLLQTQGAAGAE